MDTELFRYFEVTGYFGGALLFVWIVTGSALGLVQTAMGRSVNGWPLQLAAMLLTVTTMIALSSWLVLEAYMQVATNTSRAARVQILLAAWSDAFIILRVGLAGLTMQVITTSIGRVTFINGSMPMPFTIPMRGSRANTQAQEHGPTEHSPAMTAAPTQFGREPASASADHSSSPDHESLSKDPAHGGHKTAV